MRLATWNVNSIRARLDRVLDFLQLDDIDVLAMQELKCKPDQFPFEAFHAAGYEVEMVGYNQWNGVAICSRVGLSQATVAFPGAPRWNDQVEARALCARVGEQCGTPLWLWSLYVPNGRELDHPHYEYKLSWLSALQAHLDTTLKADTDAQIALVGDFNIAPEDDDVWSLEYFAEKTHVSAPERAAFARFGTLGFQEVTRKYVPQQYTYWDYQRLRFPKNEGMRIDFVLTSPALGQRVRAASIERDERKGKGASDHVPVIVEID
ncbi:MAG: exodeoxyribonuclease III [Bowdeniella nasicola]|nr:exodeoxyribonuclease III [Bowdeniella nasicola]